MGEGLQLHCTVFLWRNSTRKIRLFGFLRESVNQEIHKQDQIHTNDLRHIWTEVLGLTLRFHVLFRVMETCPEAFLSSIIKRFHPYVAVTGFVVLSNRLCHKHNQILILTHAQRLSFSNLADYATKSHSVELGLPGKFKMSPCYAWPTVCGLMNLWFAPWSLRGFPCITWPVVVLMTHCPITCT